MVVHVACIGWYFLIFFSLLREQTCSLHNAFISQHSQALPCQTQCWRLVWLKEAWLATPSPPVVVLHLSNFSRLHTSQLVCSLDLSFLILFHYFPVSRIRRNLSIHIARFSASESPRAIYQHSQNSPIFAGSKLIVSIPKHYSLSARIRDQLCQLRIELYFISSCLFFTFNSIIFTSAIL